VANTKKSLRLKVGDQVYRVEFVKNVATHAHDLGVGDIKSPRERLDGLVDFNRQLILVDRKLRKEDQESTIFHELLHICLPYASERMILNVEEMLFPILRKRGLKFLK